MSLRRNLLLLILSAMAILVPLVSAACRVDDVDLATFRVGLACETASECPYYLACVEKTCRPRCSAEGQPCRTGLSGQFYYGVCRSGGCFPGTPGSQGTCDGSTAASATVVRSDIPSVNATASRLVVDRQHAYIGGSFSDTLGNLETRVLAVPLDAAKPIRTVFRPAPNPSASYSYSDNLARAGQWLFVGSPLVRIPAPPPDVIEPVTVDSGGQTIQVLAQTEGALVIGIGDELRRIDGVTGTIDPSPLDTLPAGNVVAVAGSKIVWIHQPNPAKPIVDAADREILVAEAASGAASKTGVVMPASVSTFGASPTAVFFSSPNGKILKLDLTTPGVQSMVVRDIAASGTFVGGFVVFQESGSSPCGGGYYQSRFYELATGVESTASGDGFGYNPFFLLGRERFSFTGTALTRQSF